mgnify:CR=1 FL=1
MDEDEYCDEYYENCDEVSNNTEEERKKKKAIGKIRDVAMHIVRDDKVSEEAFDEDVFAEKLKSKIIETVNKDREKAKTIDVIEKVVEETYNDTKEWFDEIYARDKAYEEKERAQKKIEFFLTDKEYEDTVKEYKDVCEKISKLEERYMMSSNEDCCKKGAGEQIYLLIKQIETLTNYKNVLMDKVKMHNSTYRRSKTFTKVEDESGRLY